MKHVLSIDGGGIRGLLPAIICAKIEEFSGKAIRDTFDLLAGTSTGGILALGLASGVKADSLVELYSNEGVDIFSHPNRFASFAGSKYRPNQLLEVLERKLGKRRLTDIETKVMVTAYNLHQRQPLILKNWCLKKASEDDVDLVSAALATSAAPTYFPPTRLWGDQAAIDGGIFCNNPALLAYSEARKLWESDEIKILSLGTGKLATSIFYKDAQRWGKIHWIVPLLDCLFDGASAITDAILVDLSRRKHSKLHYYRMQTSLDHTCDKMDDASDRALGNLNRLGNALYTSNEKIIREFLGINSRAEPIWHGVESEGLDKHSKYLTYHTSDIVLDELRKHKININGLAIRGGFTIGDLEERCFILYRDMFSKEEIRSWLRHARAYAFTIKYAKPIEDEKLISPEQIAVPGLRRWEQYLMEILNEYDITIEDRLVLDVGAGHGEANTEFYKPLKSVCLVDISEAALDRAKKNIPHATTFVCAAEDLVEIEDESVHIYLSFRTFQSTLFDVRAALHEAFRVIAPNGSLLISVPIMFPKRDGTVSWGLLKAGERTPSVEYANEVASYIAKTADTLGFEDVSIDERSPYELYIIGTR